MKKTALRSLVRLFSLTLLICILSVACSKKEGAPGKSLKKVGLEAQFPLLAHVPNSSFFFLTAKSTGAVWEKFKASPWGQSNAQDFLDSVNSLAAQTDPGTIELLRWFLKESMNSRVKNSLVVASCDSSSQNCIENLNSLPPVGALINCESASSCSEFFQEAKTALAASNALTVQDVSANSYDLQINPETLKNQKDVQHIRDAKFRVQLSDSFVAISPKPDFIDELLKADGFPKARFPKLESAMSEKVLVSDRSLIFSWLEKPAEATQAVKDLPIEQFYYRRDFTTELEDLFEFGFNENGETFLQPMAKAANFQLGPPQNSLLAFSLSGGSIQALLNLRKQASPLPLPIPVEDIGSVQLSATMGGVGSLFPNILIGIESGQPAKAKQILEGVISTALKGGNLPVAPEWQSTKIREREAKFIMSPLGIGAFIAQTAGGVALASSQAGLEQLIDLQEGKGSSLFASKATSHLSQSNAFVYMDFVSMAEAAKGLQSSLSMFTGGQDVIEPKQLQQLEAMGRMDFTVAAQDRKIALRSTYRLAQQKS